MIDTRVLSFNIGHLAGFEKPMWLFKIVSNNSVSVRKLSLEIERLYEK